MIERPLQPRSSRECGALLARSRSSEIADAALSLLARADDVVLTSDAGDIRHLLETAASGARVRAT